MIFMLLKEKKLFMIIIIIISIKQNLELYKTKSVINN